MSNAEKIEKILEKVNELCLSHPPENVVVTLKEWKDEIVQVTNDYKLAVSDLTNMKNKYENDLKVAHKPYIIPVCTIFCVAILVLYSFVSQQPIDLGIPNILTLRIGKVQITE